jgi:hypothetical protein
LLLARLLRDQARYGRERIQVKGAIEDSTTCYCTRYYLYESIGEDAFLHLREETLKILARSEDPKRETSREQVSEL